MRLHTLVMFVLAIVFGGLAMFAGQRYLAKQASLQPQVAAAAPQPAVAVTTIVVASTPIRYGDEIDAKNIREVSWPADALPSGGFGAVKDLLAAGEKRIALAAIEPNEPILPGKITGPGQRGTLSALIEDGLGAVTIQVNEVIGIAGFVLPGDRVDVLLTRHDSGGDGGPGTAQHSTSFTDVVLQNVRVLAVGQTADERADKPTVVSAVTVEVGSTGAQKVALASKAGSLSLMLRKAGEVASRPGRRVALSEIGAGEPTASQTVVVRVARGMERKEYAVPVQGHMAVNANVAAVTTKPASVPQRPIRSLAQPAGTASLGL